MGTPVVDGLAASSGVHGKKKQTKEKKIGVNLVDVSTVETVMTALAMRI
jgi:hypothetical protein